MTKGSLYAFWRYDTFPFAVGGTGEFADSGDFKAEAYGGMVVRRASLIAVYPRAAGEAIQVSLDEHRDNYIAEQRNLLARAKEKVSGCLPELRNLTLSHSAGKDAQ